MTLEDIKNILENEPLIKEYDININSKLVKNKIILDKLELKYPEFSRKEFIYLIKHKADDLSKLHIFCLNCGKKNKVHAVCYGYKLYCCNQCSCKSKMTRSKRSNTYQLKSDFEKQLIRNNISKSTKIAMNNMSEEDKNQLYSKRRKYWSIKENRLAAAERTRNVYRDMSIEDKIKIENKRYNTKVKNNTLPNSKKVINKYKETISKKSQVQKDLENIKRSNTLKNKTKEEKEYINYKKYKTKKKNGTFKSSNCEDIIYQFLIYKFNEDFDNVLYQYNKDKRYPFICDFYIKSLDLFIEINFDPSHGKEHFDSKNFEHLKIIDEWTQKSKYYTLKYNKRSRYDNFIEVWTKRDVRKFQFAKQNNLNYLTFYNWQQFYEWFSQL